MWVEVHAPEVAGGIVAFVVPLAGLACFAVCQKRLVGRSVNGDPDLARLFVDAVGMPPELMLAAEAVGIVRADGAFEA